MKEDKIQQEADRLFKEKKYYELISLLTDEILNKHQSPSLYILKAKSFGILKQGDSCVKYSQKAIDIDPLYAMAYNTRGGGLVLKKEYDAALADYNKAIELKKDEPINYTGRALIWNVKGKYDDAIKDSNKAISLDRNHAQAYYIRGGAWAKLEKHEKAIEDYTKAIELNKQYSRAYNSRGILFYKTEEYEKAIDDYTKAIESDRESAAAYYNRALIYKIQGHYENAIDDYSAFIRLTKDTEVYFQKNASSEINELKKKIADQWYDDIDKIVQNIKQILQFEQNYITHYTSLSAAKAMILDKSLFRLSEGSFLNDTSEGKELFNYLSFNISNSDKQETISEIFIEKPFIGSFVAENKHNDLTLWRMYGKEAQIEAKGCALTINREAFIANLEIAIAEADDETDAISKNVDKFTFYRVAYCTKNNFLIPGGDDIDIKLLNELLNKLKTKIKKLKKNQKPIVAKLLNDIVYLFKSAEYQYENEVRLVIEGVGFAKKIESNPPKVYIELINIAPVLNKITLGPKIERADEWAAAFHYFIKEENKDVEIILSHLPFK